MPIDEPEYVSVEVIAGGLYPIENIITKSVEPFPVGYRMRVTVADASEMVARGVARIAEDN